MVFFYDFVQKLNSNTDDMVRCSIEFGKEEIYVAALDTTLAMTMNGDDGRQGTIELDGTFLPSQT